MKNADDMTPRELRQLAEQKEEAAKQKRGAKEATLTKTPPWHHILIIALSIFILLAIVIIYVSVFYSRGNPPGPVSSSSLPQSDRSGTSSSEVDLMMKCQDAIRRKLQYPSSADFHMFGYNRTPTIMKFELTAKNGAGNELPLLAMCFTHGNSIEAVQVNRR